MITSTQNPIIKLVKKLGQAKHRKSEQLFVAEGLRTIETFLSNKTECLHLLSTESVLTEAQRITSDQIIEPISPSLLKSISSAQTPSGLLGIFKIPQSPNLDTLTAGCVLAQIQDPGNMGTLIRTTAAMGFKSIVCIESCDPWSPKVVQATAGTIATLNLFQCSWNELYKLKERPSLNALVVQGGSEPSVINKNSLIVVGNEANGIPDEWVAQCEQTTTLPMPGNTESLNAAVAGSIALYLLAQS